MTDTTPRRADDAPIDRVWSTVIPRRRLVVPTRDNDLESPAPEDFPYELVDRPQPPPVPNGWYAAMGSDDLDVGQRIAFIAVARELVAYRGDDGEAHVLDAHCPHMGAHLGGGEVHGDTLRCPYHGWRFGGDGACVEIPYSDARIPSRACVKSYPVREQDGLILFWFHAGEAAPQFEVPRVEEVGDDAWSGAHVFRTEFVASLQDMAENNVDYTHFYFVHGREALDESTSAFTTDGPFSTVVERFVEDDLTFTRFTFGPGIALLRVPNVTTVLTTTTPIDRRHVRLLWHFYFPLDVEPFAEDVIAGVVGDHGLEADMPIWRDKIFRDRPLLVKGDGPIAEFRRWYAQFYEGNTGWSAAAGPRS